MKALNRILNLFAVCGILLLVFMFFPSIDSYFNKLKNEIRNYCESNNIKYKL